jgi:hypothetical protein
MNGTTAVQGAATGAQQGTPPGGVGGAGGGMMLGGPYGTWIMLGLIVVTAIVLAIVFWKIASKSGIAPWIGLLGIIPVVNLVVGLYLAFVSWPALKEMDRLGLVAVSVAQRVPAGGSPTEGVSAVV